MSSTDVRSILDLPARDNNPSASSSQFAAPRRSLPNSKKPDGISRELYALIGDNAPFLAETQATLSATKYRERPKPRHKDAKWELVPFTPLARQPQERHSLRHWVRVSDGQPEQSVEYFGAFSVHGPSIMEYSQYEYDQHLTDPGWTEHETAYLFNLLRDYDLRFIIVADRYIYVSPKGDPPRRRTVEEIKDRYFTVCRRLIRTRTASDPSAQMHQMQAHAFDKTREIRRKQYASELYHLTAAEIAEEEALYVEIKRLEQVEKRYRADRDDLMRTVMGLDSGLVELDQDHTEAILGVDKAKKRKRADEEVQASPAPNSKKQKEDAAHDITHCIYRVPPPAMNPNTSHLAAKHPPHVPAFVRSTKLPVPRASVSVRVNTLMVELGVETQRLVMPTRNNLDALDGVLAAGAALVDMQRQVQRVQQELDALRKQGQGFVAPVPRGGGRSESVTSNGTSVVTNTRRHD